MLDWKEHGLNVGTYTSEDLCSCIWVEADVVCWDVSGPGGRGTLTSGSVGPRLYWGLSLADRATIARRQAELYIAGFRRGRQDR